LHYQVAKPAEGMPDVFEAAPIAVVAGVPLVVGTAVLLTKE
jgi:hypothetical protein